MSGIVCRGKIPEPSNLSCPLDMGVTYYLVCIKYINNSVFYKVYIHFKYMLLKATIFGVFSFMNMVFDDISSGISYLRYE